MSGNVKSELMEVLRVLRCRQKVHHNEVQGTATAVNTTINHDNRFSRWHVTRQFHKAFLSLRHFHSRLCLTVTVLQQMLICHTHCEYRHRRQHYTHDHDCDQQCSEVYWRDKGCYVKAASLRMYSPMSAWWKTTIVIGSTCRHSAVDFAATPKPCQHRAHMIDRDMITKLSCSHCTVWSLGTECH